MSNYNSNLSNKSYFRSIIPKDLRNNFEGKDEFRLSLRYVINGDTKILCLKLKEITDKGASKNWILINFIEKPFFNQFMSVFAMKF